jgi:hypothetical protein
LFQVNTVVAEIDDGNPILITPLGSQTSTILLSQGASSSVQGTPEEDTHASTTTSMVHNIELAPTTQSTRDPNKNKVRYFLLALIKFKNLFFTAKSVDAIVTICDHRRTY